MYLILKFVLAFSLTKADAFLELLHDKNKAGRKQYKQG